MRLSPSLVAVKKIAPNRSRAEFDPGVVDQAARAILEAGAIAAPLIVRRTGLESFDLLAGELGYHAAARAREIDSLKGEMVLAFICEDGCEQALICQLELLGAPDRPVSPPPPGGGEFSQVLARIEHHLAQRLAAFVEQVKDDGQATRDEIHAIASAMPRPHAALEVLNDEDAHRLLARLKEAKLKGKTLETVHRNILAARRSGGPFASLTDALERVEKLGPKGLVAMVDAWTSQISLTPRDRRGTDVVVLAKS